MQHHNHGIPQLTILRQSKAWQLQTRCPIPGMLAGDEMSFYKWLGAEYYEGNGEVVDAGCWLGSSTWHLWEGLRCNPHFAGKQIVAFDWFNWDPNHNQFARGVAQLNAGDDFYWLTERCLSGIKSSVELRRADYGDSSKTEGNWQPGLPIEILIVDAAKAPLLFENILRSYRVGLIPGRTIIFFQDYCDYFCWFLAPFINRAKTWLEPAIFLPACGAGFRVVSMPGSDDLTGFANWLETDAESLLQHFDEAIGSLRVHGDASTYWTLRANKTGALLAAGRTDEARENVLRLDEEWPVTLPDGHLQNAYRRLRHAETGLKDLTLVFRTKAWYQRSSVSLLFPRTWRQIIRRKVLRPLLKR